MNVCSNPGIAMLFSAGTFLYVATVHVLPEVHVLFYHCIFIIKGQWDVFFVRVDKRLPLEKMPESESFTGCLILNKNP
jgi:hypothetical protein